MKDSQSIILTSFITALKLYQEPLPNNIIEQLNEIANNLETRVTELDAIAQNILAFKNLYDQAFQSLLSRSATRKMGQEFFPSDEEEKDFTIENITPDIREEVERIEANLSIMKASEILLSNDPSETARQQFN